MVRKLLQLFVVSVIENLQFFFYGSAFPAANSATARMLLLFLHFPQDRFLFHFNKRSTFFFS
jgi:hypothetical protein